MRWLTGMLGLAIVVGTLAAQAATVTLEDGRTLKGRVIVRGDVLTVLVRDEGKERLYQYPVSQVVRIVADDPDSPNLVSRRTALRAGDSRRSEPLFELERGLEVQRIAVRRGWVQVEAWNEEARGFILGTELASEVHFSPEERATIRARLGVVDPTPPYRSPETTRPQGTSSPASEQKGASIVEDATGPDQQSDTSLRE